MKDGDIYVRHERDGSVNLLDVQTVRSMRFRPDAHIMPLLMFDTRDEAEAFAVRLLKGIGMSEAWDDGDPSQETGG